MHVRLASVLLLLTAIPVGCGRSTPASTSGDTARIRASLVAASTDDIASVLIRVTQGATVVAEEDIVLSTITLQGQTRTGGDAFFVLQPGSYLVTAIPFGLSGGPSTKCAAASASANVIRGQTTEVVLALFCDDGGTGGLDIPVVTEHPPRITDFRFRPSKFTAVCEDVAMEVVASHPDGLPLSYAWAVTSAPAGAVYTLTPAGNRAGFDSRTPGDYAVTVTVSDPLGHTASLTVPIHVAAGPMCDGARSDVLVQTFAPAIQVAGGLFDHFDINVEDERNEDDPQLVAPGPLRGTLSPSQDGVSVMSPLAGNAGAGVDFPVITSFLSASAFSGSPPDMSGASSGNVVLVSGNTFAAFSKDGGLTFTRLDPTTIFPSRPTLDSLGKQLDGGLCCDQVILYVPQIDRFIWLMQFWRGSGGGPNMLRIAAASPAQIVSSNGSAWTYWDLRSSTFGMGNNWMDYPDLSVGQNFLYGSVDQVGAGLLVFRIPLAQIRDSTGINIGYTNPSNSARAYGGHLAQVTGDEIFWAGHNSTSQMVVYSLREDSNTYFWRNVNINSWPNTDYTSITPGGIDWLQMSNGFPGAGVIGATRSGNDLWFAWMAARGGGFAHPHIQMVHLNRANNFSLVEQVQIWNGSFAFAYPALSTNVGGEIGLSLAYGGGGTLHANHAVGYWGDFVVYPPRSSDASQGRWGDYVAIRPVGSDPSQFAAVGFTLKTRQPPQSGNFFDPHFVQFRRPPIIIK